jgi:hypothetical protein
MSDVLKYIRAGVLNSVVLPRLWERSALARFALIRKRYVEICSQLSSVSYKDAIDSSASDADAYDWKAWSANIRSAFQEKVPLAFLWQPIIAKTMVFGGLRDFEETRKRIEFILSVYDKKLSEKLLHEDLIGLPRITNAHYMTSANRAHHAYHLASYQSTTGRSIWGSGTIVEWGGGYGGMARIIRRLRKGTTYVLIDLPELCALQYIYLGSLEGEENVNLVLPGDTLAHGKLNIIPVSSVLEANIEVRGDAFISTWALTESPEEAQTFALDRVFFKADKILLAYAIDEHNRVRHSLEALGCVKRPVALLGDHCEYAFR